MSLAYIDPAVVPILDEALELAEEALLAQQAEQLKAAAKERDILGLRQQLADQERVILEKVANTQRLDPVKLEELFDRFEELNILTPRERVKLAAHVQRDPSLILPVFQKAAQMLAKAPTEGSGVEPSESDPRTVAGKDRDGWDDLQASR